MSEDLKEMRNVTRGREGGVEGPGRGAHRGFRPMGEGGGVAHNTLRPL